jgi:flagellar hook protein FlgE
MGINSALLAGVSGLRANSSALAALSDNIANVNTIGYKRSQAEFQTIVTGKAAAGSYNAGGVTTSTRQYTSQQGLLQQTTSATDLGIQGNGFFIATEKPEGLQPTDPRFFTRAGSFQLDQLGFLKNAAGLYLQGWPLDLDGRVLSDPSDLNRLQTINVTAIGGTAEQTTRIGVNANLNSATEATTPAQQAALAPPPATAYSAATNSMALYAAELERGDPSPAGVRPDFEFQVPVSDSKGGRRSLAISFLKSAVPNEWHAEIRVVPATDVENGTTGATQHGQIRSGKVVFTADGRYNPLLSDLFGAPGATPTVGLGASPGTPAAAPAPTTTTPRWAYGLGVEAQDIQFDFGLAAGGLSQFNERSVVQSVNTNGVPFGNLSSINIDKEGFVTAEFDNGVTRKIAQVALATFGNTDELTAVSGNAYRVSLESGTYNLKPPGQGGAGSIAAQALESSTVDLSTEFTGLITTQRAYSASSKIITTADEMLEELLRIKR